MGSWDRLINFNFNFEFTFGMIESLALSPYSWAEGVFDRLEDIRQGRCLTGDQLFETLLPRSTLSQAVRRSFGRLRPQFHGTMVSVIRPATVKGTYFFCSRYYDFVPLSYAHSTLPKWHRAYPISNSP